MVCGYGHLNYKTLKLLGEKGMVYDLLTLKEATKYEERALAKQTRRPFPTEKTWRASEVLQHGVLP